MVSPAQINSYTDFQGLNQLRSQAGKDPGQALKQVASQFETQFVKMMLQSMREATPRDGLFNSEQTKTSRACSTRRSRRSSPAALAGLAWPR